MANSTSCYYVNVLSHCFVVSKRSIYIYIYIKVKLATIVEGDQKDPFLTTTTL